MTTIRIKPRSAEGPVIEGELVQGGPDFWQIRLAPLVGVNGFAKDDWELIPPSTIDVLNALGENAMVAHPTDAEYYPYVKQNGKWYGVGYAATSPTSAVERLIDRSAFVVAYEGIKEGS